MNDPIEIQSIGAGVQSSTMALMAACGQIKPMPLCGIFADTGAEPKSVYDWLAWLEKQLPFPVYRVVQGTGLVDDALKIRNKRDGTGRWIRSAIPHFVINKDGTIGHGPRQCTRDFKITPIIRKIKQLVNEPLNEWRREYHENKKRSRILAGAFTGASTPRFPSPIVVQSIGISLDEVHRMKDSRDPWIKNRWPLVDMGMTRSDCLKWMKAKLFPIPPRSACVFCPYHSDAEWLRLKTDEPEEFKKAVEFERKYGAGKRDVLGEDNVRFFIHRSCKPLDTIDFSKPMFEDVDLFGNECEGMCGL
jgi:hypothetical protein